MGNRNKATHIKYAKIFGAETEATRRDKQHESKRETKKKTFIKMSYKCTKCMC